MKNFKRYFLAISLGLLATTAGMACGWDGDDPSFYDLFRCTKPLPNLQDQHTDESVQFWGRYAGLPADDALKDAVRYLRLQDFEDGDDETIPNLLVSTLREQGKTDGLALLQLNTELNELVESTQFWYYQKVTPEQYQEVLNKANKLKVGKDLAKRLTFLKMRILSRLNDNDAMMRLWNNDASQWEPSEIRDRMEGYVAGIYFRKGEYDKALPIYFRLRDGGSISLCVNRMLDSTSIEEAYRKDPNAMILPYILEDYANYFYHASQHDYWEQGDDDYKIWTKVTREREGVVALAEKVVAEGKAKDLQMWQTFVGFMQLITGQENLAYQTLTKAEDLPGNGSMDKLIRHYKFAASLAMTPKPEEPEKFDQYVADEIKYYKEVGSFLNEPEHGVLNGLYGQEIAKRLQAYVDQRQDPTLSFLTRYVLDSNSWELDHQTPTKQVQELQHYVKHGGDGPLGECLVRYCFLSQDFFNELIGTKLIREGNYEEAKEYLEKVSDDYLRGKGITPYLMKRQRPDTPFQRKDRSEIWDLDVSEVDNIKYQFCLQVLSMKEWLNEAKGEKKAEVAFNLADMLFQASPAGDLWAISEYSWSSADYHYNELNVQADHYLKLALDCTDDFEMKVKCHFGLAANPTPNGETYLRYEKDKKRYYICTPEGPQREAYNWLHYQTKRDSPIYESCDWLKWYVADNYEAY
ncbi:MAG: hypothetical protein J5543_06030 [Bacteroidales bacterium]|nr:hypothetical protein [Bacteroidales bacterium]